MFSKEEVAVALRIVSMVALGAYPSGESIIEDIESLKDEELKKLTSATIVASLEAKKLVSILDALGH